MEQIQQSQPICVRCEKPITNQDEMVVVEQFFPAGETIKLHESCYKSAVALQVD